MKKLLPTLVGLLFMFMPPAAHSQILTNATAVKPIVPYAATQSVLIVSTGTANELTGNSAVPTVAAPGKTSAIFGVFVLNSDTTANIYCCYNNALCSTSNGIPILAKPSSGNYNSMYFSMPTWEKFHCISDTVNKSAIVVTYK